MRNIALSSFILMKTFKRILLGNFARLLRQGWNNFHRYEWEARSRPGDIYRCNGICSKSFYRYLIHNESAVARFHDETRLYVAPRGIVKRNHGHLGVPSYFAAMSIDPYSMFDVFDRKFRSSFDKRDYQSREEDRQVANEIIVSDSAMMLVSPRRERETGTSVCSVRCYQELATRCHFQPRRRGWKTIPFRGERKAIRFLLRDLDAMLT